MNQTRREWTAAIALSLALTSSQALAQTPTTYGYDVHGRLVTANTPAASVAYTYDAAGNRTNLASAAVTAPVVGSTSTTLPESSINYPLTLSLSGGAAVAVAITSPPSHGTATASGTSIVYTPASGYSGSDSLQYNASNTCCTAASMTASITVTPVALNAMLSATTWNWLQFGSSPATQDPNIVVTAAGGSGGYTYLWQRVSGVTSQSVVTSTVASVYWTGSPPATGKPFTSGWTCTVSDSAGHHVTTGTVTVTFEHDP